MKIMIKQRYFVDPRNLFPPSSTPRYDIYIPHSMTFPIPSLHIPKIHRFSHSTNYPSSQLTCNTLSHPQPIIPSQSSLLSLPKPHLKILATSYVFFKSQISQCYQKLIGHNSLATKKKEDRMGYVGL
jgi:hypothetical protein